ncbi:MAG: hemerythrin family protein [Magnetococcales bacterium]|nr:hemerythrin family protein [Magnetococcales bacterium]
MRTPSIILWKPGLSIGVTDLDNDHKMLIKMINRLFGAVLSLDPARVVRAVLDELLAYVQVHFDREETHMRCHNYPDYVTHQKAHQHLLERVERFRRNYEEGLTMNLREEIEVTLRDWLVMHIQEQDKRLGLFLNQLGIQ